MEGFWLHTQPYLPFWCVSYREKKGYPWRCMASAGLAIAVCVVIVVAIENAGGARRAESVLAAVCGDKYGNVSVRAAGVHENGPFGGATYTWRLEFEKGVARFLAGASESDRHDLRFAASNVECLLNRTLRPNEQRAVWRKGHGSWGVYAVSGDDSNSLYLLVLTM
jgi:hypothetical protein